MISQQGRVVASKGDDVVIKMGGVSGCPSCDAGNGCGAGIFGRLLRNRKTDIKLKNSIDAIPGQTVNVGISEQRFLKMVFQLYVGPLIAGLLGVVAGFILATKLGFGDWASDLFGLMGGVLTAGAALLHGRRRAREFPVTSEVHLQEVVTGFACANNSTAPQNNDFDEKR